MAQSESFQSALTIFQNILGGGELPETFRQSTTTSNLLDLGQSSLDISQALNENIAVRESQRAEDNLAFGQNFQLISDQLVALGQSQIAAGTASAQNQEGDGGFFGNFKLPQFPSFDQLRNPLIIAGLALAALIVLPRVIKSGFK